MDDELSPQVLAAGGPVTDLQPVAISGSLWLGRVPPRVVDVKAPVPLDVALLAQEQPVRPRARYDDLAVDVDVVIEVGHARGSFLGVGCAVR